MRTLLRHIILFSVLFIATVKTSSAQQVNEYEVKAAFVLNFLKFTEFSTPLRDKVTICTLGAEEQVAPFAILQDGSVHGQVVVVQRVVSYEAVHSAGCAALFIASSAPPLPESILAVTKLREVVTIGESDEFLERGGIIRFYLDGSKVRFAVAPQNADQAGLKFSSKLLALSEIWNGRAVVKVNEKGK